MSSPPSQAPASDAAVAFDLASRDKYDALLDDELAAMDRVPYAADRMGAESGLRVYMTSYVRAVLPLGLALASWTALRGGSFVEVVASLFGATVCAGVAAFLVDALRGRRERQFSQRHRM
jgi:hypothetical protein